MKTASLIANSCEAIAILNNSDPVQIEAARDFGKHIGLAFQIQDDRLDFIADAEQLGKVSSGGQADWVRCKNIEVDKIFEKEITTGHRG